MACLKVKYEMEGADGKPFEKAVHLPDIPAIVRKVTVTVSQQGREWTVEGRPDTLGPTEAGKRRTPSIHIEITNIVDPKTGYRLIKVKDGDGNVLGEGHDVVVFQKDGEDIVSVDSQKGRARMFPTDFRNKELEYSVNEFTSGKMHINVINKTRRDDTP